MEYLVCLYLIYGIYGFESSTLSFFLFVLWDTTVKWKQEQEQNTHALYNPREKNLTEL